MAFLKYLSRRFGRSRCGGGREVEGVENGADIRSPSGVGVRECFEYFEHTAGDVVITEAVLFDAQPFCST